MVAASLGGDQMTCSWHNRHQLSAKPTHSLPALFRLVLGSIRVSGVGASSRPGSWFILEAVLAIGLLREGLQPTAVLHPWPHRNRNEKFARKAREQRL